MGTFVKKTLLLRFPKNDDFWHISLACSKQGYVGPLISSGTIPLMQTVRLITIEVGFVGAQPSKLAVKVNLISTCRQGRPKMTWHHVLGRNF